MILVPSTHKKNIVGIWILAWLDTTFSTYSGECVVLLLVKSLWSVHAVNPVDNITVGHLTNFLLMFL